MTLLRHSCPASRGLCGITARQRFAQVTNPPIDPLRETHVMSLRVYLGERAVLSSPLLDAGQLDQLAEELPVRRVDMTFPVAEGVEGAQQALERLRGDLLPPGQNEAGADSAQ